MFKKPVLTFLTFFLLLPVVAWSEKASLASGAEAVRAQAQPGYWQRVTLAHELDAYYSNVSVEFPFTRGSEMDGSHLDEREVYSQLFRHALKPRTILLEASIYPLPMAGTWLKRHHSGIYTDFDVGHAGNNNLNIIDGVTAGFQEPWAISAFMVGSSMRFHREGEARDSENRGYMGWLLSYGAKHIHNNVLIDDNWVEVEWKLKGERKFRDEELSWSFRLGLKEHGNPDIRDLFYIGLRRSNLDYLGLLPRWLGNVNVETMTEFDRYQGRFLRQEVIVGRNFPFPHRHFALALDVGVIYESSWKYKGALYDPDTDALTFVFRPNIRF